MIFMIFMIFNINFDFEVTIYNHNIIKLVHDKTYYNNDNILIFEKNIFSIFYLKLIEIMKNHTNYK